MDTLLLFGLPGIAPEFAIATPIGRAYRPRLLAARGLAPNPKHAQTVATPLYYVGKIGFKLYITHFEPIKANLKNFQTTPANPI